MSYIDDVLNGRYKTRSQLEEEQKRKEQQKQEKLANFENKSKTLGTVVKQKKAQDTIVPISTDIKLNKKQQKELTDTKNLTNMLIKKQENEALNKIYNPLNTGDLYINKDVKQNLINGKPIAPMLDKQMKQTAVDLGAPIVNAGLGTIQGFQNTGNYLNAFGKKMLTTAGSTALDKLIGNKEVSNAVSNVLVNRGLEQNPTVQKINKDREDITNLIAKNIERTNNPVSKKLAELTPSIGSNLVSGAVTAVNPLTGTALFMTSAGGSYLDEAKQRGMNDDQALGYATIMGLVEGGTEALITGKMASRLLKATTGKELGKAYLQSLKNDLLENFLQESATEWISEGTAKAFGGQSNWGDFEKIAKDSLQAGIDGVLSALIMQGAFSGVSSAQNVYNKLTNNQNITEREILTALDDFKKANPEAYNQTATGATEALIEQGTKQSKQTIPNEIKTAQNETSEQTKGIMNNKILPMQNYQYEKSDNVKIDNIRQDANRYFNNSKEAKKFVGILEQIIQDKNIDIRLNPNLSDQNGNFVNGMYQDGVITINPNSNRTGEFIAIHELTHAIGTDSMRNIVEKYRESNAEFNKAVERLLQNYNQTELTDEAMTDVAGQLFGNQEFINNLAQTNPNIFQKIYNEIKYLWHQFAGYKNQNQFIEDLQYKWEQAYKNNKINIENKVKYSTQEFNLPKNVKEIKNMNEFLRKYREIETNQTWKNRLDDAYYSSQLLLGQRNATTQSPLAYKRSIVQQYLDYKNRPQIDNKGRKLSNQQSEYFQNVSDKLKDENGNLKTYYHGTQRGDRVGNIFDSSKATSGPMAFFTDNADIAKSYSENKTDTSLSREYDTEWDLFKANNQNLDTYWRLLSESKRNEIRQKGYEAGLDEDYNVAFGEDKSKESFGNEYEYLLKRNNNNALKALYDIYVNSGNLWQEEISQFKDVLDYVGVDNVSYLDPYKTDSKVYEVYLDISKPFDTNNQAEILNDLEKISKTIKYNPEEAYSADMWDKTNIEPSQWIEYLKDDIKEGTTHSWTRIPDFVTDYLKSKGYDGIVDTGGKNGGITHQVVIPFYSEQIKNVDNTKPTINKDIRYSRDNQIWQDYLEDNFKATGTRTNLNEIKVPIKEKTQSKEQPVQVPYINYEVEQEQNIIPIAEGKQRKHYKNIANSAQVTKETRQMAKGLYNTETYTPISNYETLTKVNQNIQRNGSDRTYEAFMNKASSNERITLQDIATGERLIQIYSQAGDYNKVNELVQTVAMLGTELGQQVQAFSLIQRASPEGQLQYLQRLVDRTNIKENTDIKVTDEMAKKILSSKNQEELQNNISEVAIELANEIPLKWNDKLRSWRYLAMLGNPRTHIRNLVANIGMGTVQDIKNNIAGLGEDIAGKFVDFEKTKTLKPANKDQKAFAKQDANAMKDLIDGGGKFDIKNVIQSSKKQFNNKLLNAIAEFNTNLLDKEDKIFLKNAYQRAMQNYMSANNLSSSDMEGATLQKARQYASIQAQEATFHQFNSVANALANFENKNIVTKLATSATVPFKKTPMNIAKTGFEYSPLNIANSVGGAIYDITSKTNKLKQQLEKGNISQAEYKTATSQMVTKRIDQMAKGLTGTSIAMIGYMLASQGIIKAGSDGKDEEFEEKLGKQTYSITIGDNTYTLDWLSPSAIPLFLGATLSQMVHSDEEKDKGINALMTSVSQALEPMTEMSMLQGLTNAISSYESGSNMFTDLGASMAQSYLGQYIPTALGQVTKTIDPNIRDTSSTAKGFEKKAEQFINQTKAKIPGLSYTLPTKTDIWGNERIREGNIIERYFNNAIAPYNKEKIKTDKVSDELLRVYNETGEASVLPTTVNKDVTINKEKYTMTNEELAKYKKQYGQQTYKLLNELTSSSAYKNLTNEQKQDAIDNLYKYVKEQVKIDYAKEHKLSYEESTLSNVVNKLKDSDKDDYFEYIAKTKDISKEADKMKLLTDSNYSKDVKKTIYENSYGSDDTTYNLIKNTGIDIDAYLKYKSNVTDNKKDTTMNYLNSAKGLTQEQKLLLAGFKYTLSNSEQSQLAQYINNMKLSKKEKLEIYGKLKGFKVYKDGRVTW